MVGNKRISKQIRKSSAKEELKNSSEIDYLSDINNDSEQKNDSFDLSYVPDEQQINTSSATSKSSSNLKKNLAQAQKLILDNSKNLTLTWKTITKKLPQLLDNLDESKKMMFWYKNQKKCNAKQNILINPTIDKMISQDMEEKDRLIVSQIVESSVDPKMILYYIEKDLKLMLSKVTDFKEYDSASEIISTLPENSRLKGSLMLAIKFQNQLKENIGFKIAFFIKICAPTLEFIPDFKFFTKGEIQMLQDLIQQVPLCKLNKDQAQTYCQVLISQKLFNITQAHSNFKGMENDFWIVILRQLRIPSEVYDKWLGCKEKFLRQEVVQHSLDYGIDIQFTKLICLFNKSITKQELLDMFILMQRPNFEILVKYLDKSKEYDFQTFQLATSYYMDNTDPLFLDTLQDNLKGKPLEQWHEYTSAIQSYKIFGDNALEIVKQSVFKVFQRNKLSLYKTSEGFPKYIEESFQRLNDKIKLKSFKWQFELVYSLYHLIFTHQKEQIIVSLGTGHGKSVVIQLLAQIIDRQGKGKIIIVCLNNYLAAQGKLKYSTGGGIEYMSLNSFNRKKPNPLHYVIYDEIDQMMGCNSFYTQKLDSEVYKCQYRPSIMSKWGCVMGFSGTIAGSTQIQFDSEFQDSVSITIPSLRQGGQCNKVVNVIKLTDSLVDHIEMILPNIFESFKNAIIIFENTQELNYFVLNYKRGIFQNKNVLQFINFEENYSDILNKLEQLNLDNFVILTTKEGSRGVDYKGPSPAHVVICYEPSSYADCVQALGRGCRTLDQFSEGTIISENPITNDPSLFLKLLEMKDIEIQEGLKINAQVAKLFNDSQVNGEEDFKIIDEFRNFMEEGKNFQNQSNDPGEKLWKSLRNQEIGKQMPLDAYQDWI